jgi:DHA2 family multidrug resistance protein
MKGGGAWRDAMHHAGAQIYGMAMVQGRLLAYVDAIWVMVGVTAILVPIPFLMNKPKKVAPAAVGH